MSSNQPKPAGENYPFYLDVPPATEVGAKPNKDLHKITCMWCEEKFSNKISLANHFDNAHKEQLKDYSRRETVFLKPTAGRKQDLPRASTNTPNQDNNFEQELKKYSKVWAERGWGLHPTHIKEIVAAHQSSLEEAIDEIIEKWIPISLALNEYPKASVLAYNEFRKKTIENLELFKKQRLATLTKDQEKP